MFKRLLLWIKHDQKATIWSLRGISSVLTGVSVQQWIIVISLATGLAFILDLSGLERAVLIAFSWNILLMEMVNTAIETVIDRIGEEFNTLSGRAKDVGSGLVFGSLILAVVVWVLVLVG
jgi:diacylglycerol kinase (ATP)